MIKYYNVNSVRIRVVFPTNVFNRLKMFECEPIGYSLLDIDLVIGTIFKGIPNDSIFFTSHRHKLSFWRILIEGLTQDLTTIYFDGDPFFSSELLMMLILEPLIAYKLSQKGGLVIHASALSINGNGALFTGDTGIGKTSILLHLLQNESTQYYSDDQTFVIDNNIHAYPVPIGFRKHLVDTHSIAASQRDYAILVFYNIINRLLSYYPNLTLRIPSNKVVFTSGFRVHAGSIAPLKHVFILEVTHDKPKIQQISGSQAYHKILHTNRSNEDKLKIFYDYFNRYDKSAADAAWDKFAHNLQVLTHRPKIAFYSVELNKKYDYSETLDEIKRIIGVSQ